MTLSLTAEEQGLLDGQGGPAVALAMHIVVSLARLRGATRLRPVTSAHLDGCLYHGQAGLDFAERLVELGGKATVPTTLNVGSLDLLHPELTPGQKAEQEHARRLMDACVRLGARPTWT
ncbi:MAG: aconitase X, partial [Pseudonocardiaceae bacterium]